jgi:hypothetical protein
MTFKLNKGVKFDLSVEDNNVNEICLEYMRRADHGLKKYGVTTERKDLDLMQWVQHLKEELGSFMPNQSESLSFETKRPSSQALSLSHLCVFCIHWF